MGEDRDYYEVLGLPRSVTDLEIKAKYKELALQYHPDRNPNNTQQAEEAFKEVSEAYEVLGDAIRRAQYDLYGYREERPIYEHLFNGQIQSIVVPGGLYYSTLAVGYDIWVEYNAIPFSYERRLKCAPCKGQGFLRKVSCRCSWGLLGHDLCCQDCKGRGFVVKKYCSACDARGYTFDQITFTPHAEAAMSDSWAIAEGMGDWTASLPGDLYYRFSKTHG